MEKPGLLQCLAGGQVQVGGLVVAGQVKSLSLLKKPGARLNFQKIGADVGHARVTAKSHRFPYGIGGLALQAQHQVQRYAAEAGPLSGRGRIPGLPRRVPPA